MRRASELARSNIEASVSAYFASLISEEPLGKLATHPLQTLDAAGKAAGYDRPHPEHCAHLQALELGTIGRPH